jgi:beta-glucosidase
MTRQARPGACAIAVACALPILSGCAGVARTQPQDQPQIGVRSKAVLDVGGLRFRDANGNGRLDPYEDC